MLGPVLGYLHDFVLITFRLLLACFTLKETEAQRAYITCQGQHRG